MREYYILPIYQEDYWLAHLHLLNSLDFLAIWRMLANSVTLVRLPHHGGAWWRKVRMIIVFQLEHWWLSNCFTFVQFQQDDNWRPSSCYGHIQEFHNLSNDINTAIGERTRSVHIVVETNSRTKSSSLTSCPSNPSSFYHVLRAVNSCWFNWFSAKPLGSVVKTSIFN